MQYRNAIRNLDVMKSVVEVEGERLTLERFVEVNDLDGLTTLEMVQALLSLDVYFLCTGNGTSVAVRFARLAELPEGQSNGLLSLLNGMTAQVILVAPLTEEAYGKAVG